MSRIEFGLANPTLTVLHALAQGLEIDLAALLAMPDVKPAPIRKERSAKGGAGSRLDGNQHSMLSKIDGPLVEGR